MKNLQFSRMKVATLRVISLLLTVLLLVSFHTTVFASGDFEPVEDTPYGIPIYESVDDVDLAVVIRGHGEKRLLDIVNSAEITSTNYNKSFNIKFSSNTLLVKDETLYVENFESRAENAQSGNTSTLRIYDGDNSKEYRKDPFGKTENPITADAAEKHLGTTILPFDLENYEIDLQTRKEEDGKYCFTFNMKPLNEEAAKTDFSECALEMDSSTSLVTAVKYHSMSAGGESVMSDGSVVNTLPQDTTVQSSYSYGVEKEPDYSLMN